LVLENRSDVSTIVSEMMITMKEQVSNNLGRIIIEGKERQSSTEKEKQLDENMQKLRAEMNRMTLAQRLKILESMNIDPNKFLSKLEKLIRKTNHDNLIPDQINTIHLKNLLHK
jgi:ribosome-binding ATPase YchF (GTP1/OBG family)